MLGCRYTRVNGINIIFEMKVIKEREFNGSVYYSEWGNLVEFN